MRRRPGGAVFRGRPAPFPRAAVSAQLGFEIEEGTLAAIKRCSALCASLSAERVRDETEKILLSDKPERVGEAVSYGLFIGRLDSGEVSYEKLRRLSGLPRGAPLRWSAFCALLLEQSLIALPESFLKSMRLDAGTVRRCASGVTLARQPLPKGRTPIKRLLAEFGEETVLCAAAADKALRDTEALRAVKDVLESGECWSVRELAIAGDDCSKWGFRKALCSERHSKRLWSMSLSIRRTTCGRAFMSWRARCAVDRQAAIFAAASADSDCSL
jgi:hypothetical protein